MAADDEIMDPCVLLSRIAQSEVNDHYAIHGPNNSLVSQNSNASYLNGSVAFMELNSSHAGGSPTSDIPIAGDPMIEDIKFYLMGIVNPTLCVCGLVGNILNILVLTRRRLKVAMDCSMERAAHFCLLALATCDMCYCISALPKAFLSRTQVVFDNRFWLYVQIYGPCLQNIFTKTSVWLTVIMAVGRYAAICRPLHARYLVELRATRIAVALTFLFWVLLMLPSWWTWQVRVIFCMGDQTFFWIDQGYFSSNARYLHSNVLDIRQIILTPYPLRICY